LRLNDARPIGLNRSQIVACGSLEICLFQSLNTVADIFVCATILVVGAFLSLVIGRAVQVSGIMTFLLYSWHTLFAFLFHNFVLSSGGDAAFYYEESIIGHSGFDVGTWGIVYITKPLTTILQLSFLGVNLVHNIIGALGLVLFWAAIKRVTVEKSVVVQRIAMVFPFIPSMSFFTGTVGKDAISFLSINMLLWASQDVKRKMWMVIIAVVLMAFVRPHIGVLVVVAFLISFVFRGRGLGAGGIVMMVAGGLALYFLGPLVLEYVGLSDLTQSGLGDYLDQRRDANLVGGGAIDISDMNLIGQMFTVAFRPLLTEATSAIQYMSAVENLLLLLMFVGVALNFSWRNSLVGYDRLLLSIYTITTWVVLGTSLSNLGLATRQKWMFLPILFFLAVSYAKNWPRRSRGFAQFQNRHVPGQIGHNVYG
jgi:hypothetical protein